MQSITARSSAELAELLPSIQGRYFSVDDINFDPVVGCVRIPISEPGFDFFDRAIWHTSRPALIEVGCVLRLQIEDTERVGTYGIAGIIYRADAGTVQLSGDIPLEVVMQVSRLEVVFRDGLKSTGESGD